MHSVIGAIIKQNHKILMVNRKNVPLGWACPAGHIDDDETPIVALKREVQEETGLTVIKFKLLDQGLIEWNVCSRGVKGHYFKIYEITGYKGIVKLDKSEHLAISWKSLEEIKRLNIEPVWKYWFKKIKII
jgi:8-oxo-dGTP pyrophosphatase MutT (NUDIX family)